MCKKKRRRKKEKQPHRCYRLVMTKYLLACMRTFRIITQSVAIHHVRPLSAAVTLPRLSTRRHTEELSPWITSYLFTTVANNYVKVYQKRHKVRAEIYQPCLRKAWEGLVSPVKGLRTPLFTYATPSPLLPNSIIRQYYRAFLLDMVLSYLVKVSWSHSGVRTPAARRSCLPCWLFLDPTLSVFRRKPR